MISFHSTLPKWILYPLVCFSILVIYTITITILSITTSLSSSKLYQISVNTFDLQSLHKHTPSEIDAMSTNINLCYFNSDCTLLPDCGTTPSAINKYHLDTNNLPLFNTFCVQTSAQNFFTTCSHNKCTTNKILLDPLIPTKIIFNFLYHLRYPTYR